MSVAAVAELVAGTFGDTLRQLLEEDAAAARAEAGVTLAGVLLTAECGDPGGLIPGDVEVGATVGATVAESVHGAYGMHARTIVFEVLLTAADVAAAVEAYTACYPDDRSWLAAGDQARAELRVQPNAIAVAALVLGDPCPRKDPTA